MPLTGCCENNSLWVGTQFHEIINLCKLNTPRFYRQPEFQLRVHAIKKKLDRYCTALKYEFYTTCNTHFESLPTTRVSAECMLHGNRLCEWSLLFEELRYCRRDAQCTTRNSVALISRWLVFHSLCWLETNYREAIPVKYCCPNNSTWVGPVSMNEKGPFLIQTASSTNSMVANIGKWTNGRF